MDPQNLLDDLKLSARRVVQSDFLRVHANDDERRQLAEAPNPIIASRVQDYAAWRRSVLLLASIAICLTAGLAMLGYTDVAESLAGGMSPDGAVTADMVIQRFGEDNIDLLETIQVVSIVALIVCAVFVVLAVRSWARVRRSRRFARRGWYVLVGTPLILAAIPWGRMLDFSHLGPQGEAVRSTFGVMLGISLFTMMAPKLIGMFPGLIRASMTLKTLVHESATPGYAAALFAPIYAIFLVVVVTSINQIHGNIALLCGIACLAVSPLVYVYRGKDLLRPHTRDEAANLVAEIRRTSSLFNLIGTVLLAVFIFNLDLSFYQQVEFFCAALGGVLLMTVVGTDFLIALLTKEFQQAKALAGTEFEAAIDEKLGELAVAGLGELRTSAEEDAPASGRT